MSTENNLDSQVMSQQSYDQVLSQTFDQSLPQSFDQTLPQPFDQALPSQSFDQMLEPSNDPNDLEYELDDGTQIRASQIHFDNEDPHVDLSAEKIPFIKYTDDVDEFDLENVGDEETRKFNIVESPVSRWSSREGSPRRSFVNTLPFKLVCNNTSVFEAQFTKYLESSTAKTYTTLNPVTNRNKSPRSLIRDNYKNYDDKFKGDDFTGYTREEILNMFKDSPVASLPYEGQNLNEKRRHVRKTDPSRSVHKNWNSKPVNYDDGILIGDAENQNCIICGKFVENKIEKLYVFDKEDQKRHRASPQKRTSSHLKIICEGCLEENFKPSRMKGPNQSLGPDEYLVIRNNQQYIFQKTKKIDFKTNFNADLINDKEMNKKKENEKVEFVKVEIGSDGEIVTKPIDNDPRCTDDVVIVKDEDNDESSSDVEIIEPADIDENIIDNLEDADEDVKEFLGKYQADNNTETELKCRFCEKIFAELSEVMDHGEEHKHDLEDGAVYPCPLCDYGYSNAKWLKGHLKAAHEKKEVQKPMDIEETIKKEDGKSKPASPIARRTRSSCKRTENDGSKESPVPPLDNVGKLLSNAESADSTLLIKTEVKQEALASSDDEIWIVQTGDDDATKQLESLFNAAKGHQKQETCPKTIHKCFNCSRIFTSEECLSSHKCRIPRRGRKRKSESKEDSAICVPTKEDFLKVNMIRVVRI
ncbi:uncharacterized protein LOC135084784 [Ostrinia nubilalis]|uniref:uncharacterized protein LOC135084784 n=1 Tax=Ostrinia nubilalis TaxID=29057 RepID=UPI0030825A0D